MQYINNIPAGYKDSAVGIIPQEWEVNRLGEICQTFKSGMTITSQNIEKSGLYPVYGGNGLRGYTDSFTHNGDYILIGRQGALCGNINFIKGKAYISEHAIAVQPNEGNSIEFLRYKLDFWNLNRFSESSAQPGLSVEKLVRYKLAIPPMAEQRKIAEILGVWDEAIEKQSRLIEKLELRKRALMQCLLTGRTRLPGFTTPWQKVKLGEIGKITSAGVDKKINEGEVPVRLLNFVDVFYRDFIYNNELTHWVTAKSTKVEQCSVQKGDIFFTPSSEMPTDIALSAVAMEDMEGVVYSYHIVRLRLHIEMDLYYRAYAFKTDEFYKQAERICDGSGQRYVISQDGFRNMSIHLPSLPEQKAIAEVLTVADKEIATHRKKLDSLRLQKRGLMQQLLTGKTRVKIYKL